MMPRLGQKYSVEIELITKPRIEYFSVEYPKSGLPKAPAIMVDDEIIVEGADVEERRLENTIRLHLGLPIKAEAEK
jgi:hypothetical protein